VTKEELSLFSWSLKTGEKSHTYQEKYTSERYHSCKCWRVLFNKIIIVRNGQRDKGIAAYFNLDAVMICGQTLRGQENKSQKFYKGCSWFYEFVVCPCLKRNLNNGLWAWFRAQLFSLVAPGMAQGVTVGRERMLAWFLLACTDLKHWLLLRDSEGILFKNIN
jgi:hypothetical protein